MLLLIAISIFAAKTEASVPFSACVEPTTGMIKIDKEGCSHGIAAARGSYDGTIDLDGWGHLDVATIPSPGLSDDMLVRAAGFLEGGLTHTRIAQYQHNVGYWSRARFLRRVPENVQATARAEVDNYLSANWNWTSHTAANLRNTSYLWNSVALTVQHLEGLADGYNAYRLSTEPALSITDFVFMNSDGDLYDILYAVASEARVDWASLTRDEAVQLFRETTHCSAMIKLSDDGTDLYTAHVTWDDFIFMLRIFKRYTFQLSANAAFAASEMAFSSYPGIVSSIDDFYVMNSGLAVIETTNDLFNTELYEALHPVGSLLSWVRATVANRLAKDGLDWAQWFTQYNSGTYNNQWMVVDYNKARSALSVQPGSPLPENTLIVLEQWPGYVEKADLTAKLNADRAWVSYNTPYFTEGFRLSGYAAMEAKFGDDYSYDKNPRALMFKHLAPESGNWTSFKTNMQYNRWQTDPDAKGDGCNGIAARCDLGNQANPSPFGGMDAKATNLALMSATAAEAISGPTHVDQAPFAWQPDWTGEPHVGLPDVFDFDWVTMKRAF